MTTLTLPRPTISGKVRWAVVDAMTVARRNLTHIVRMPQLIIFATIQPILFVLMFAYVFGGAIDTPDPSFDYIDFLMPGIFVQTVAFGATQTGVGLAEDLGTGLIERFRTLPMARSAVLAGRTLSDQVRNVAVILLMLTVGSMIGFDWSTSVLGVAAAIAVLLAFSVAMSWVAAYVGLATGDAEAAQAAMFPVLFPLVFASSAFVPTATMPGWMQVWANNQPVSQTVDAVRALVLGGETLAPVLRSLGWSAALVALFAPLAIRHYRRA